MKIIITFSFIIAVFLAFIIYIFVSQIKSYNETITPNYEIASPPAKEAPAEIKYETYEGKG